MTTLYDELLALGYSREDMDAAADEHRSASTRVFGLIIIDTPDETPIIGVGYRCDYRAEEEWGVRDLAKSLKEHKGKSVSRFTDREASLILSTRTNIKPSYSWGDDLYAENDSWPFLRGSDYRAHYDWSLSYAQGLKDKRWELERNSVADLRVIARELGHTPGKRVKAELITLILSDRAYSGDPGTPNTWPGWFHDGHTLVLTADSGVVADTLRILAVRGSLGTLQIGGLSGAFSTGLSVFDSADIGPKLSKQIKDSDKWHAKQMKRLKPVEKFLSSKGYGWYALGNPREGKDGTVVYWLNSKVGGPGLDKQAYGWYSLEDLRALKFVSDAKARK